MRVLVDGVFFQLAQTGIARVWVSLLTRLGRVGDLQLFILDREGCPSIAGIEPIAFPSYTMTYTATDSLLIQKVCDEHKIDVFTSTYYTTAVTTPQVQIVYDMIPEVMGFDMSARVWKEKQLALSYASRFACISGTTRDDLHKFYPALDVSRTVVAHCGVDTEIFGTQASHAFPALQKAHGLSKPYFLFVGSRDQHKGYKNAKLFFEAISEDTSADFDVVCVGGERTIEPEWISALPSNVRAIRLDLSDQELAAAYSGALALVYPSLYEGFGLPVIEAMASGCPVITTRCGSLAEVAGDAALIISGHDRDELLNALRSVRDAEIRDRLVQAGLARAARFDWNEMTECFRTLIREAYEERSDPEAIAFHERWKQLRTAQAEVDVGVD